MSYLVDTNVISETTRLQPEARVIEWLEATPTESLHISALSLGEIRNGVERLAAGERLEALRRWLEHDLVAWFEDRVLGVDAGVADRWGRLRAATAAQPLPAIDGLIAATALHHGLRLVTRNESDFRRTGVEVINPWRHS